MNRDDVLRMAREAGGAINPAGAVFTLFELEDFAALLENLVAAAEREACIRVIEIQLPFREDVMRCADAIRARAVERKSWGMI
jgi:hypothetical protein